MVERVSGQGNAQSEGVEHVAGYTPYALVLLALWDLYLNRLLFLTAKSRLKNEARLEKYILRLERRFSPN